MIKELGIPESDINSSLILKTMFEGSGQPTVFMPNYGDFGPVIHKLIKLVHFFKAPKKIVCCKQGDEALFPSVDEFYYDWEDFVEEKHKWAFFTKKKITGIGKNEKYNYYKEKYHKGTLKIYSNFGNDHNYIHLWQFNVDYIFEKYDNLFRFMLQPKNIYNIHPDVVISPRKRESRKENNFLYWNEIVKALNNNGYTVGCTGSENESFEIKNTISSWHFEDKNSASIEMLLNCKLYLGLDTGVSHLAAFMSVPMIVFSDANPKLYASSYMKRMTDNYFLDLGKNVTDRSLIIKSVLTYLEKNA